jgi:hypothetical protein
LREREPDFEINNTILVYYMTAADLNGALVKPLPEMNEPARPIR